MTATGDITRGFTAHVFPKIQSVIISCMYSYNIYEQLSPMVTKGYISTCEVYTCAKQGKVPPVSQ